VAAWSLSVWQVTPGTRTITQKQSGTNFPWVNDGGAHAPGYFYFQPAFGVPSTTVVGRTQYVAMGGYALWTKVPEPQFPALRFPHPLTGKSTSDRRTLPGGFQRLERVEKSGDPNSVEGIGTRLADITDGTSNTMLFCEMSDTYHLDPTNYYYGNTVGPYTWAWATGPYYTYYGPNQGQTRRRQLPAPANFGVSAASTQAFCTLRSQTVRSARFLGTSITTCGFRSAAWPTGHRSTVIKLNDVNSTRERGPNQSFPSLASFYGLATRQVTSAVHPCVF